MWTENGLEADPPKNTNNYYYFAIHYAPSPIYIFFKHAALHAWVDYTTRYPGGDDLHSRWQRPRSRSDKARGPGEPYSAVPRTTLNVKR